MKSTQGFGRKLSVVAGLVCGAAVVCFGEFGTPPPPQAEGIPPALMIVPPSRETLQALHYARDALKQNRTGDAIALLQRVIELPEDYFTDKSMHETLKSETLRILTGLNASDRKAYELLQGTPARTLLTEIKATGNSDRLAELVRRYPLTEASLEAAEMLALAALDEGRVWQAAVQLSQLRQWPLLSAQHGRRLALREALAWQQAGQTQKAAELLLELTSKEQTFEAEVAGKPLPKFADANEAVRWLAQVSGPAGRSVGQESGDWLSARGSVSGTAPVRTTGPIGGPLWRVAHLADLESDLPRPKPEPEQSVLLPLLADAETPLQEAEQLTWTTSTPIVAGELMIFRTARDVVALDCKSGAVRWRSVLTDPDFDQLWSQEIQPAGSGENGGNLTQYLRERLLEDRSFGSVSSDGRLVYALNGQSFPSGPVFNNFNNMRFFGPQGEQTAERFNRLAGYDLKGGRLVWEIGGDRAETAGEFAGHYFLGPPLTCDGNLFALAEVQGEIRLLALDASPQGVRQKWSQPLAAPKLKITEFGERQRQALMPACSDGIVICPTGTGAVIAVDFAMRRLLWAYQYPSRYAAVQDGMNPMQGLIMRGNEPIVAEQSADDGWIDGNPIIAGGRVFITPIDSDELHCLNLADGKPEWTMPRDRAVYLAGADHHRAVLIGPERIDAVRVADGAPAWTDAISIPTPTGRGVWMPDRYLIPLSTGEIATVDLTQGRILARSKVSAGRIPGNLAAGSGCLVSLSARDALAFGSLEHSEQIIADKLAADPEDAEALALRGEFRLHRGEREAGLADLRAAIAKKPEPYVKSVLAAALLEGLRTDFARNRDHVSELETLTDDPQQRNEFHWLVARGLKEAGEPLAAFERMTHLIEHSLDEFSVESEGGPWQSRNDRRLRGLFAALYRQANPDDRRKLDEQILARLPAADGAADNDIAGGLRRFLRAFGFHPAAIAARQQLTALLDPEVETLEYVWELSRLAREADPAVAAPAVGSLAKWFLTRKRFDDLDLQLSALDGRLADAVCAPNLTGRQLAEQLRADADYAESRTQYVPWPDGEIDPKRSNQPNGNSRMTRVPIVGPVPARYSGWSFETDQQGMLLLARDEQARHRWTLNRTSSIPANQPFFTDVQPSAHRVHLHEHLVAWTAGTQFLVAADLEPQRAAPRILWHESLTPPGGNSNPLITRAAELQKARLLARRQILLNQQFMPHQRPGAGAVVALGDSAVIFHNGRKLFAADPLTGKLLWSRKDLSRSFLEMAADDELVAVVDQDGQHPADQPAQVTLFRTADGEQVRQQPAPAGVVAWIGGSRILTSEDPARRITDDPMPLEFRELTSDEPIWRAELSRPAAIRVWNQAEVFTIEQNRRLTVRSLHDGVVRWTQDLELDVPAETLFVQKWKDRYLVVLGATTPAPAQPGSARVVGFDPHQVPICGYVAALGRETGDLLWQTAINEPATDPTAFDPAQPAGWPVLLFAGRMFVTPQAGVPVPQQPRLTTTIIDKETGARKYFAEEPLNNIQVYFVDVDPERNRFTANFLTWSVELHYTGKRRK